MHTKLLDSAWIRRTTHQSSCSPLPRLVVASHSASSPSSTPGPQLLPVLHFAPPSTLSSPGTSPVRSTSTCCESPYTSLFCWMPLRVANSSPIALNHVGAAPSAGRWWSVLWGWGAAPFLLGCCSACWRIREGAVTTRRAWNHRKAMGLRARWQPCGRGRQGRCWGTIVWMIPSRNESFL